MSADLTISITPFEALTLRGMYDLLHLRDIVFVVGQKVTSEPEVDGRDPECLHVAVHRDGELLATARIFHQESPIMVGRIAVRPDLQGQGVGTWMMARIGEWLGSKPAEMHAQAHLERWYTRCGWQRFGDEFIEAEIRHVSMRRPAISG